MSVKKISVARYESYREYVDDLEYLIEDYKNGIMPVLLYFFRKYGTTDPDVSDNKDVEVLNEFCNRIQEYIADAFGVENVEIIDCRGAYDDREIYEEDIDIRYTVMTKEEFDHHRAIEKMSEKYGLFDSVAVSDMIKNLLAYVKARRYFEETRPAIKDPAKHNAVLSKYITITALLTKVVDDYSDIVVQDLVN